jgi:tRNA A-37 threonylcarbamoyl transferase component Bud32
MKVSRELWREVEPLLSEGLELDAAARAAWLAKLDVDHPSAAPVVRAMLATHDRAERSGELETVSGLAPKPEWSSPWRPHEHVGPFELLRALGHGGMGEVWLARQADGRVEREVALKLPAIHLLGETGRERFRRERDILARLNHPHIARLYDAGVTDRGQPWLAMELVEGLSLLEHAQSKALAIEQRLALFRQVLAAVAHAHRHLVVHRDLKPANILIDASGQVKLLDFGIAKLVDDQGDAATGDLTRLGGRVMTLRYAAPEQVAAGTITTATDVYALGVILHELVTGLSPYVAVREGKPLTDVSLMQQEPSLPSSLPIPRPLARALSGDLDAIVLKAMRRDPADRYASVELFDEDIDAHLGKRLVKARAGTWRYRAGRYVARNRFPLAIAATVVASLAVGLAMVEQQRRVAVAERERAERHSGSVRKLANTLIFDVHSQIENLPGTLKAREMLIATSLEYLNALAGEAGNDPALLHELAVGYYKIGNIQGDIGSASMSHYADAVRSFEKARDLFAASDAARPNHVATLRDFVRLRYILSRGYFAVSDPRWKAEGEATLALAERIAALPGATINDRAYVAISLAEKAHLTSVMGGFDARVQADLERAVALFEDIVREAPDDRQQRRKLAGMYQRAAGGLSHKGRTPQSLAKALEYGQKCRDLVRAMSREEPGSLPHRMNLMESSVELALQYSAAGRHAEAGETIAEAHAIGVEIAGSDPGNVQLAENVLRAAANSALIAYRAGEAARSVARGREAVALARGIPEGARKSRDVQARIAEAHAYLGLGLLASAERAADPDRKRSLLREARPLIAGGVAFIEAWRASQEGSVPEEDAKELSDALERCDELIRRQTT